MLITREDLAFDYHEARDKPNADQRALADACGQATATRATGRGTGNDFLFDGQSPAISEVVTIFASATDARASVAAASGFIECALRVINEGKLNGAGFVLSDATSASISVNAGGDASSAFQVQAAKTLTGHGGQTIVQYTLVFASKGRVGFEMFIQGSGDPVDPNEVADFAQNAAARIRQQ